MDLRNKESINQWRGLWFYHNRLFSLFPFWKGIKGLLLRLLSGFITID